MATIVFSMRILVILSGAKDLRMRNASQLEILRRLRGSG
jgi:hypothetical protein